MTTTEASSVLNNKLHLYHSVHCNQRLCITNLDYSSCRQCKQIIILSLHYHCQGIDLRTPLFPLAWYISSTLSLSFSYRPSSYVLHHSIIHQYQATTPRRLGNRPCVAQSTHRYQCYSLPVFSFSIRYIQRRHPFETLQKYIRQHPSLSIITSHSLQLPTNPPHSLWSITFKSKFLTGNRVVNGDFFDIYSQPHRLPNVSYSYKFNSISLPPSQLGSVFCFEEECFVGYRDKKSLHSRHKITLRATRNSTLMIPYFFGNTSRVHRSS